MSEYNYQLFCSSMNNHKLFDVALFKEIKNYKHSLNKPENGLWTSTYNEKIGSAWIQWCACDEPEWISKQATLFRIINNPRVYEIDSFTDLENLQKRFPDHWHDFQKINWEKIAKVFDCVHLTENGQSNTQFGRFNLYGWDSESTLWFNLRCLEKINDIEIKKEWRKQQ